MTHPSAKLAMVLSTTATREQAQQIAGILVEEHLAACVQISGPITSVYRWHGAVETESEYRLVAKTTLGRWPDVRDRIAESHPYDEPQILLVPIDDASPGYQQWVLDETRPR